MKLTDEEVLELLKASIEQSRASGALLSELRGGNNQTVVTVSGGNWIAALSAVVAIACAFYVASVKSDARAESLDRRAEDRWVRDNLSAIRAYIHTGKLKPIDERKEADK